MTLNEILPTVSKYNALLVTGAQRSGTTIAAHILAHELGYRYVDEDAIDIDNQYKALDVLKQGKVVLQAPALCHIAHNFTKRLNYCVVLMRRPIEDILKSENRINWRTAYSGMNLLVEQKKYAEQFGMYGENIAAIKYFCFENFQKHLCDNVELDYDSLKTHPMFKDERREFQSRQWEAA